MRTSIAFVFILIFTSCGVQYDGETILNVKGNLTDASGNPIANQKVKIIVGENETGGLLFPSATSDIISFANTDWNGIFQFLFPAPINNNLITVEINTSPENTYLEKRIAARKDNFINYQLNLGTIKLYRPSEITELTLAYNKVSIGSIELKDVVLEGNTYSYYDDLYSNQYENQYPNYFQVAKNQTLTLKYKTVDYSVYPNVISNYMEPILVANIPVTHTITY